jgi:hypothetical protein
MMKKFLILMLVLGMASAANAMLKISVTPVGGANPQAMLPSDYLLLDIYTDTGLPLDDARDYALIVATTCGTISGGVKRPLLGNFAAITYTAQENAYGVPEGQDGGGFTSIAAGQAIPVGNVLFDEILFHCESDNGLTVITLGALDLDWNWTGEIYDQVTVNQIPEPMTIMLLGLGGLLLRRRK